MSKVKILNLKDIEFVSHNDGDIEIDFSEIETTYLYFNLDQVEYIRDFLGEHLKNHSINKAKARSE